MKFIEKIVEKQNNNYEKRGVTVAFLGDSVTQGCFEVYRKSEKELETVFDKTCAYHKYFADIFSVLCPSVPVNIINAGISGGTALHALDRLERDVLCQSPDLVIVCFGLNDSSAGMDKIGVYTKSLGEIFERLQNFGTEIIFMTPNMKCTDLSCHITDSLIKEVAMLNVESQINKTMDNYIEAALKVCKDKGVTVCDCYRKWKKLSDSGINITQLLSNKINHPTREMNYMFAYSLVETIFEM
ncbi:MAG: GDSL family lipase [Ruminococcaceae bacterium]|nr:GDSL family lipase [Oscillospiraceae bacterium]